MATPTGFPYGISAPGIVNTVATSPLALPQTGNGTLFTIAGGPIKVEAIFGIVTTVIGSVANATKLQFLHTGLTAVDLCATADVNALAAGAIYSVTGTLATLATIVAPNTNQLALDQATKWNIGTGIIRVNTAGSDGGTGRIQWYLMYRPFINSTPSDPSAMLSAGGNVVSTVTAFG